MSLTGRDPSTQARLRRGAGLWPALLLFLVCLHASAAQPLKDQPHLRRPVAAAWIEPGKLLAVANSRSGSVSVVDIPGRKVLEEVVVGEKLADITAMPTGGKLLAVDESRHELVVLDWKGDTLQVANRIPVAPFPVSVAISQTGGRIAVASLWSRKLTILEPNIDLPRDAAQLRKLAEIDLPFNPRSQVFLPDTRTLVVADAFGGNLAIVDAAKGTLLSVPKTGFESIQAIALSSDGAQLVSANRSQLPPGEHLPAYSFDSRIGVNFSTLFSLTELTRREGAALVPSSHSRTAGEIRAMVAVPEKGVAALTSSGHIYGPFSGFSMTWKQQPDAVRLLPYRDVVSSDLTLLLVNRFSDSLSVFKISEAPPVVIELGKTGALAPADRGEQLFYTEINKRGWMSCHSCHTEGHTSGQLADTLGDGTEGSPKRIPTLLGSRLTDPWAWNGQVRNLNEQVRKSLETTMHAKNVTPQQIDDITAFLHTLPPPPPLQPATDEPADKAQLARGQTLFGLLGCAKCHVPPLTYTSPEAYDVGLADEKGQRKFNPPSLRGVSQGYSFFHDGRAKKLEDVFTVHGHQLERPLEKAELADLLRFLRSL